MVPPCIHCKVKGKLKDLRQRHPKKMALPYLMFLPFRKSLRGVVQYLHQRETKRIGTFVKDSIQKFQQLPQQRKDEILKDLNSYTKPAQGITLTLLGASRRLNNPNNRLDSFFKSVLENTLFPDTVEVLVRIDNDDDLLYYHSLWKKYGSKLRIRFVMDETVRGYENLFRLVSELLEYLADTSTIVFGFADDCLITRKGWDLSFLQVLQTYPDNIFFINTFRHFSIPYENKNLFFWLMWHHGPPALFSAVGRRVLDITKELAKKHAGWTAYGNSVMCDSFFEALQLYLWELTGEHRAPVIADTIIAQEDVAISPHKEGGLFSASPVAIRSNREFLKTNTQNIIAEMSAELARALNTEASPKLQAANPLAPVLSNNNVAISLITRECNAHGLADFLANLVQHTSYLPQVEVIVELTTNADITACYEMQTKYRNELRISFITPFTLSPPLADLHRAIAPTARLVMFFDEHCKIVATDWDGAALTLAKSYPSDIFFINTSVAARPAFADSYLNSWEIWRTGNGGYYPLISRKIVDASFEAINRLPKEKAALLQNISSNTFYETLKYYLQEIDSGCASQSLVATDVVGVPRHVDYEAYKAFLGVEAQDVMRDVAGLVGGCGSLSCNSKLESVGL